MTPPIEAPPEALRLRVTQLRKDEDGVWRARVHLDGQSIDVERRPFWAEVHLDSQPFRPCLNWVAAELQARLPAGEQKPKSGRLAPKDYRNGKDG